MTDYIVQDTQLTAVANAIRSKTGSSNSIIFPDGFVTAISSITGGGSEPVLNMPTTTLSFELDTVLGVTVMKNSTPIDINYIIEGATYDVVWNDGEPITCTAWKVMYDENTELIGIGNIGALTGTPSSEPFIIGTINGEMTIIAIDQITSATASVTLNLSADGSSGSGEQYALITVTVKRSGVALAGATVTATKDSTVVSGVSDASGQCTLKVPEAGTYSITSTYDGFTSSSSSVTVSSFNYTSSLSFFTATITVATETGATVTVTKDDKTYTDTGEDMQAVITVYETGTYTVTSSYNGQSMSKTVNVTASTNYNVTIFSSHLVLEDTSWEAISQLSAEGNPQNYFAVGDTKSVHISGKIVNDTFDATLYAYIIGFNHNESVEGKGIHFGTFKTADGKDVALVESKYGTQSTNENGFGFGNSSDRKVYLLLRDVFGQTYSIDYGDYTNFTYTVDDTSTTSPTADTFLAALPADLLAVLKKFSKKNFERTNTTSTKHIIHTYTMFLNVLSEYEVFGTLTEMSGHNEAANIESYQKQYEYYQNGNSKVKYKYNAQTTACEWWLRDQTGTDYGAQYTYVTTGGAINEKNGKYSLGLAPIFVV